MNTDTEEAKTESKPLGVAPIRISWADQNTVKLYGIYGYNVYRSTTPNGEFAKVNTDPIVPSPEDPNPQFVTYYDWGLPMGETFFYYIEAIQEDGSKQKATPVYPLKIIREMTPDEIKEWKADDQKKKEKPKK